MDAGKIIKELLEEQVVLSNQLLKIGAAIESLQSLNGVSHSNVVAINRRTTILKNKVGKPMHWTQRPENKARLLKHIKKMTKARIAA